MSINAGALLFWGVLLPEPGAEGAPSWMSELPAWWDEWSESAGFQFFEEGWQIAYAAAQGIHPPEQRTDKPTAVEWRAYGEQTRAAAAASGCVIDNWNFDTRIRYFLTVAGTPLWVNWDDDPVPVRPQDPGADWVEKIHAVATQLGLEIGAPTWYVAGYYH